MPNAFTRENTGGSVGVRLRLIRVLLPVLAVQQELASPDQAAIGGLAERRVAVGEIDVQEVAAVAFVDLDLRRVRVAHAEIDAVRVAEVEVRVGAAQVGELREVARRGVRDSFVLGAHLVVPAAGQVQVLRRQRHEPARLDAVGLRFPADVVVERRRPVDERQIVVVELRQAAEVGEEAPALDRQVVRQRGGDDAASSTSTPSFVPLMIAIATRERIDARRDAELAGAELEVRLVLSGIGADGIDDEADRGIEL